MVKQIHIVSPLPSNIVSIIIIEHTTHGPRVDEIVKIYLKPEGSLRNWRGVRSLQRLTMAPNYGKHWNMNSSTVKVHFWRLKYEIVLTTSVYKLPIRSKAKVSEKLMQSPPRRTGNNWIHIHKLKRSFSDESRPDKNSVCYFTDTIKVNCV